MFDNPFGVRKLSDFIQYVWMVFQDADAQVEFLKHHNKLWQFGYDYR